MRLATFNLLHGRSLRDGRVAPDRLREAVRSLDADVLGLQEVDRDQPRSDLADLTAIAAEAADAADWRFEPALSGTPGEVWQAATAGDSGPAYGIGLVSRLPVSSWHTTTLAASRLRSPVVIPGTKAVVLLQDEPRVALAAVLETPDGPMTVATTHLSFVPGWNAWQLRVVCRWLLTLPGPRVLLGDLNLPGRTATLASGWQALAVTPTYPSPAPRLQMDHVMAPRVDVQRLPPVRSVSTPTVDLSDHRPLVVELG